MVKIFLIILVIVFCKFLERWERENFKVFWGLCTLFALTVSLFDEVQFQKPQNSGIFEKNISSVLTINSGGGESNQGHSFVAPNPPPGRDKMDSSLDSEPKNARPKHRWGADPLYRPPLGGGGGGGNSGSENVGEEHRIPDESEWIGDQCLWNRAQKSDSSVSEEEESKAPGKLDLDIDFEYQYDSNANPTLLIPNTGILRERRTYTKVEFDQTAVHLHHAADLGIPLPPDFDMAKYKSLDRAGRLDYANQKVPRETVIQYQNAIGRSMCPVFNIAGETISLTGFAGKHKIGTGLIIEQRPGGINRISIVREDGTHISTFFVNDQSLTKIANNDFWVLKKRDL